MTAEAKKIEPAGMREEEYARLKEILTTLLPRNTLEVGMANGGSTVIICEMLKSFGGGKHSAIDPFQSSPQGYSGRGIEKIRQAGLEAYFEMIEDFDYLALPRLVAEKRSFDFILLDGWHSFDYTLLDFFYADLLLKDGGVLALHDSGLPSVHRVCRFIETHKPYDLLSPPVAVSYSSLVRRLGRRLGQLLGGPTAMAQARSRRTQWFSLAVYRKKESSQVPNVGYQNF